MPWVGKPTRSKRGGEVKRLRRRVRAMRAALRRKLSRLEYIDPCDADDVLAADDLLRRRR